MIMMILLRAQALSLTPGGNPLQIPTTHFPERAVIFPTLHLECPSSLF